MSKNPFAHLLASGEFSDLTLMCQGEEIKVHKAVVCSQSPVIAAALRGDFEEARTNAINIAEFDVGTVRNMVEFMYTWNYEIPTDPTEEQAENTTEPLHSHTQMNMIADYYDIPKLGELAATNIKHILETTWSADAFLDVAKEASSLMRDKALVQCLSSAAAAHIEELVETDRFIELDIMNDFTKGLLRHYARDLKELKALQNSQRLLEERIQHLDSACDRETARANQVIESADECHRILSKTTQCRNGIADAILGVISKSTAAMIHQCTHSVVQDVDVGTRTEATNSMFCRTNTSDILPKQIPHFSNSRTKCPAG